MAEELVAFMESLSPVVSEDVVWDDRMRLHVSVYLSEIPPTQRYVTSARAIVLRNGAVLVAQDQDTLRHILPGGRLEENEMPEITLRREIGEESGWLVDRIKLLGFMRFSHLDPKQPGYQYPYLLVKADQGEIVESVCWLEYWDESFLITSGCTI